ncbi:MAG: RtcB family protein [Bacteroidota bacterium]|nr:RtcB family protein [Bacteroidota bacterium]
MEIPLRQIDDTRWEIPRTGGMRVPGRIYATASMMESIRKDQSLQQVANVAHLPGIVGSSLAMPDIHWGYGFPIGGVCATDAEEGVISPGGVGYDINCGIRLIATRLTVRDVAPRMKELVQSLFRHIPTGVGASRAIPKLSRAEMREVCREGAAWAVRRGFGTPEDIDCIEEQGRMEGAEPSDVGERAWERGADQMGTLGSGNHFLEVARVEEIYDENAAQVFGIVPDGIVVMIHCGSRGFGYQICDDSLKMVMQATQRYGITLPDRQLACAPLRSPEGQRYIGAMRCAANYAFANRQVITHLAADAFSEALGVNRESIGFSLIYDICHNIAKFETHTVEGVERRLCIHRKGATRAFCPGHPDIPERYRSIGQPVLVPGDMGRCSYLCLGTERAMQETFGSSCHGAGRHMSRHQALAAGKGRDIAAELKERGVEIRATGMRTIAEEMPLAYKDVTEVVNVMHDAGISMKVARFRPLGVIKG